MFNMKVLIFGIVALTALIINVHGKVYSRCELAKELKKQGFQEKQLRDWVCLVESESSSNTAARGGPNDDGSYDYGLFQINNRYWCTEKGNGNGCQINCKKLLNDNIRDDSVCAKKIFEKSGGFNAWKGWQRKCKGKPLPDLSKCGV